MRLMINVFESPITEMCRKFEGLSYWELAELTDNW